MQIAKALLIINSNKQLTFLRLINEIILKNIQMMLIIVWTKNGFAKKV